MGQPIAVRTDFTAVEVRRLARRAKDSDQVRRLLAISAVLDGASRAEAAKVGGMDRQTLRDWVIRFTAQGPDGLINIPAPGAPAKLNKGHRAFLARIVDEGSSHGSGFATSLTASWQSGSASASARWPGAHGESPLWQWRASC